jgi:acyl transferase domain-containing protein
VVSSLIIELQVILDSAASFLGAGAQKRNQETIPKAPSTARLLALSANTPDSLRRRVTDIQDYLDSHYDAAGDVAHTLALRREHLPHRAFGIVCRKDTVKFSNFRKVSHIAPAVNFVFTGQGAQWAGMGIELMEAFPRFLEDILHLDSVLHALPDGPKWSMRGMQVSNLAPEFDN